MKPPITPAVFREALVQTYPPTDPTEVMAVELAVQAFEDWQLTRKESLCPGSRDNLFLLDAETKIKRRIARHLRDMLLTLQDLRRHSLPVVRIVRAEQVPVGVPSRPAKKSPRI
jgi:hypothetical protein